MTKYRLFCLRRILGPDDQAYLDRWPLALTPWGPRVSASLPCAGPGLSPRSSVVVLVRWSCGAATGKPTETGTTYRGIGSLAYRPASWTHRVARLQPTAHDMDAGRHRADGADVGLFTPSGWVEFWRTDRRGEC